MSRSMKVYFATDQRFDEQNQKERGNLKRRAMRALAIRIQDLGFDSLQEVTDPVVADACFQMLMTDNRWMLKKGRWNS